MNKADRWAGNKAINPQRGNTEIRAADTARLIADRPSTIVISRRDPVTRETIQLAPQTVRIEVQQSASATEQTDAMLNALSVQNVVIIGIKDHPTMPNTNIQRADRFYFDNQIFEVVDFIQTIPGRLLASAVLKP